MDDGERPSFLPRPLVAAKLGAEWERRARTGIHPNSSRLTNLTRKERISTARDHRVDIMNLVPIPDRVGLLRLLDAADDPVASECAVAIRGGYEAITWETKELPVSHLAVSAGSA